MMMTIMSMFMFSELSLVICSGFSLEVHLTRLCAHTQHDYQDVQEHKTSAPTWCFFSVHIHNTTIKTYKNTRRLLPPSVSSLCTYTTRLSRRTRTQDVRSHLVFLLCAHTQHDYQDVQEHKTSAPTWCFFSVHIRNMTIKTYKNTRRPLPPGVSSLCTYTTRLSRRTRTQDVRSHLVFLLCAHTQHDYQDVQEHKTSAPTWCFFCRFWTAVRLEPRSADAAFGRFSLIHDNSSSTSRVNSYRRRASQRLLCRI